MDGAKTNAVANMATIQDKVSRVWNEIMMSEDEAERHQLHLEDSSRVSDICLRPIYIWCL